MFQIKSRYYSPPTAVLRLWKRLFHFSCEITKCINTHTHTHRYNTPQQKVTVGMTIIISSVFYWKSFWSVGFNNYMFVTIQHSKIRMSSSEWFKNTEAFSGIISCDVALIRYLTVAEVCTQTNEDMQPVHALIVEFPVVSHHKWSSCWLMNSRLWITISLDTITHAHRDLELFELLTNCEIESTI